MRGNFGRRGRRSIKRVVIVLINNGYRPFTHFHTSRGLMGGRERGQRGKAIERGREEEVG